MKPFLHPDFKLNGESFPSAEDLRNRISPFEENLENDESAIADFIIEWLNDKDFIVVKTSGSTGIPKRIKLHKQYVKNSAKATISYFDLEKGTEALLCLSANYIAGKMMLVRAMVAGWNLQTTSTGKNPLADFNKNFDFTAMVPYQVLHSLPHLHRVKKLIVGGGAVSKKLENQLQHLDTEVFATYGMTETISHVAIRPLNGKQKTYVYTALPGVRFSVDKDDCLQIQAPSISPETIGTNDVVELLSDTSFNLLGRIDNVINTGGIKVHPEFVEEKLATYIEQSFFIASEKDEVFGDRIILVLETPIPKKLEDFIEIFKVLSQYERPKKILNVPEFIYTETGKIKRNDILKNLNLL